MENRMNCVWNEGLCPILDCDGSETVRLYASRRQVGADPGERSREQGVHPNRRL